MTLIRVQDRANNAISARELTENGYMRVPARVSRTGIYEYLASELDLTDRAPNDIVRVYRSPEQVFSPDSLSTFDNVDITVNHPTQMVDASTHKAVSVGHATSPGRMDEDGQHVVVDLLIKDQATIDEINGGLVEVSPGYTAEYVPATGEYNGVKYEYEQRGIVLNHIALVPKGRGLTAKLFDNKAPEAPLMYVVTLDGGGRVSFDDESKAALVQQSFDAMSKRVADAEAMTAEEKKRADELEAKADELEEKTDELEKKSSNDAIAARVAEVVKSMDSARKLVGDSLKVDTVDSVEIKRAAMAALKPKREWADKSAAYVCAAFDAAVEEKEDEDEKKAEETKDTKESHDAFAGAFKDGSAIVLDAQAQREKARDEFHARRYGNKEAK